MARLNSGEKRLLRGTEFVGVIQSSANAIQGGNEIKVLCQGDGFRCRADWTLRFFIKEMADWASVTPGCIPTFGDIKRWCSAALAAGASIQPEIEIPAPPEKISTRINLALTGGTYHEKLHYLYSQRGPLRPQTMYRLVIPRWALVADWSKHTDLLLSLSNLFEDTRIERNGCREFPGIPSRMADLADYVIDLEAKARYQAAQQGVNIGKPQNIIACALRDLGLGYVTNKTKAALAEYKALNPQAVEMVASGPLRPILDRSREVGVDHQADALECLALAMDTVVILKDLEQQQGKSPDQEGEGQGNGKKPTLTVACPKCGAPANKLRAHKNPHASGQVIITCTVCGHQETFDADDQPSEGQGSGESIQMDSDKQDEPSEGKGSGSDQSDGDPQEGESDDGEGGDQGNTEQKPVPQGDLPTGPDGGQVGYADHNPIDHNDYATIAAEALQGGNGLVSGTEALGQDLSRAADSEDGKVLINEAPYKPFTQAHDEITTVKPSAQGVEFDRKTINNINKEVRNISQYLRARLRSMVQAQEIATTTHGLPKGKGLSNQFMVDSYATLRAGQMPTRAYYHSDTQRDVSMAAAIVLDESSSMQAHHSTARACLLALVDPLDNLGCKVQATGFRNGSVFGQPDAENKAKYHRTRSVIYDVFKKYDEHLASVKWRFANTRAEGTTPMADGIQYALDSLSDRPEGHRLLIVITDGAPDGEHRPVIRRQLRLAKEAGIHVLGVGIGSGAQYVTNLFPDSVYTSHLAELPPALVAKLNELLDPATRKRGKRLKKTA